MLPSYTALLQGHRWYCARHGIRYTDQALEEAQLAITRARLTAAALAAGHERDEPAALLFALTIEAPSLGEVWIAFPMVVLRNYARRALGVQFVLDAGDAAALHALRVRIADERAVFAAAGQLERRATFEELRVFIARRMRPLP
jgi:hypothetical protein